jgi:ribonuclease E
LPGESSPLEQIDTPKGPAAAMASAQLPPAIREATPDGLEPFQDLQELELMNHPSYQDKSGKGGSRRRRRRDPLPTRGNGKDAPIPKDIPSISPGLDKEAGSPPNFMESEPTPEADKAPLRSSRSRGGSRTEKKPAASPQIVTVEMTPEEQKIYALMGISPLVLANEEVKEPRNTVVSVVLPGEGAASSKPDTPTLGTSETSPDFSEQSFGTQTTHLSSEEVSPSEANESPTLVISSKDDMDQSGDESVDTNAGLEQASADGGTVRRRRRRRSSANGDGSEE